MNLQIIKRAAVTIAAFVLAVSAVPTAALTASAADNLVSNSTFDSGTTGWGMYKESGGAATLGTEGGRLAFHVTSMGTKTHSVQFYYSIIPMYKDATYHVEFDISSTKDRFVEAMIQQNGGTYTAYSWKGINVSSSPQHMSYDFTMEYDTDVMAKLVFNCGLHTEDAGEAGDHTIYLDNVKVEMKDDSNVNYNDNRPYEPSININQVGYKTGDTKKAVIKNAASDSFSVVNADTKSVVYSGTLSQEIQYSGGNETDRIADFSSVKTPGRYYITSSGLDDSYSFTIGDDVYKELTDDTVKMLYLQRCGTAVEGGAHSHPVCHNTMATVYGTNQQIDVSGGWHDAGDYGRYVVPGAKAVADILYAYLDSPEMYGDSTGIPESGNNVPDIVDEAKYELDWMLKMQASDGGVYHKVTCENFPGYVMPQNETDRLIVTPVSTTATADFAGAMALAAEVYRSFDPGYAAKCLDAAKKAYSFLEANPNLIFRNPSDISTGEYGDSSDGDERYWAAAQLYRATKEDKYLNALTYARSGMDWALMGDYGNIALLTMKDIDTQSSAYTKAKSSVISSAGKLLGYYKNSPYGAAVSRFNWGSNMTVANAGVILCLAAELTGDDSYLTAATAQRDYLLGNNPLGECFVTGYGTVSPENPHHRPSMVAGKAMKGMLVGGVNSALEDDAAKAYLSKSPAAKCYVDNSESYSTNEITIYWNSPLTYLLTLTEDGEGGQTEDYISGDLNGDKKINVIDLALTKAYISAGFPTQTSKLAADVTQDGTVDGSDAAALQSWIIGKTQKLGNKPKTDPVQGQQGSDNKGTMTASGYLDYGTAPDSSAEKFADFRQGTSPLFFASDGWTNGSVFDCGWYASKAQVANGCLSLTIDKDYSGKYNYAAAEYRTTDFYGYGYYETSMQAIKNPGVVSSFFTYTGPSDNNPWDEIDIEVLGKDTTKVQFNYYTNGSGNHEYMYDLGFDASEGYHTYGFDWQQNKITWYVDGKAVYSATNNIPSTPGKIMMNVWPGTGVDSWLAPFDGKTPLTARYQWVTYTSKNK